MRVKYFLVKIFFVSFFLFILLFVNRPVKAQDNHQGQCKLQNRVNVDYYDPDRPQYFSPGSSICAFSNVATGYSTFYGTEIVVENNENTLTVSGQLISNDIKEDELKTFLQTYYQCNNNGEWVEKHLEGDQICIMPEGFWSKPCYVTDSGGDCFDEIAGEVKINTIEADINITSDSNILSFLLVPISPSPTPPAPTQEIPDGAIPCNKIDEIGLNLINLEEKGDNEWGCVDLEIIDICVSSFFNKAEGIARKFLNQDNALNELQKLGACPPGYLPSTININDPNCYCKSEEEVNLKRISDILCVRYIASGKAADLVNNKEFVGCSDCFAGGGYWSGLSCIYFSDWENFFKKNVFGLLLGLAGIIALFCIIYAAFQIQTSQGRPEKIKKGQELLTSCIMGLMVIIFSVFILRLIGVDILRIPGFAK